MHVEKEFVICLYYFLSVYGARTGNTCTEDMSNTFTVQLNCSVDEWIDVVHEAYGDTDTASCRLKFAETCNRLHASSQSGLVVNCNGKQSCREVMKAQAINNCNIIDAAAEVKYNCIKGSVNMCSPVTTTVNRSVYLHSPGFPDSVGVNSSCIVMVTGHTLQITLVEERMGSGMLNISGEGRQLWTNMNVNQYNRVFSGQAAEIMIVYDNHNQNDSVIWIRVADSGQMNLTIRREMLDASSTSTSTQRLPLSQSTSSPRTSDTTTTVTTTRAHSTTTSSFTAVTSTHGHTTDSTGYTSTQVLSNSTMVSTTVSTTDKLLIVWIASAVSGCVVTILIVVVAVVLCRKRVKKSRPLETPGEGLFELGFMNTEKHHNGFGQNGQYNQYFVPDTEFVDMYDTRTITVTKNEADNVHPPVLRDSNDSKAANDHQGIYPMTENDLYDGGFDDIREAMVDNVVYDEYDLEREKESIQDESDTSPNNSKQTLTNNCVMVENDVYDGGPPRAAKENNSDDLCDVGLDTSEGMVYNGLYDKFEYDREKESRQDELDASRNHSKLPCKDGMVENIVYERGPPHFEDPVGSVADKGNHVGDMYDGGQETTEGMVDNELYDKFKYDREKESLRDESDTCVRKNWKNDCDMVENDVYERGPP